MTSSPTPSSPSWPQFQLQFSCMPSVLSWPFASLWRSLYETRSYRVKPSWQTM